MSLHSTTINGLNSLIRVLNGLIRPTKNRNLNWLRKSGEDLHHLNFRLIENSDLKALIDLHVKTWNETYPGFRNSPGHSIRSRQWAELFKIQDGTWFCYIIEKQGIGLIGFAMVKLKIADLGDLTNGELNKIYLLRNYQRLGLGRILMGYCVRKLIPWS